MNFIRNASKACYEIRFVTTSLRKKGYATIRLYKPTKYDSRLRRYEKKAVPRFGFISLRNTIRDFVATKKSLSFFVFRLSSFVLRLSSFVFRFSSFVFRPSFFVIRFSLFVFRFSLFVFRYSFFVLLIEPMKRASCFSMLLTEANRL